MSLLTRPAPETSFSEIALQERGSSLPAQKPFATWPMPIGHQSTQNAPLLPADFSLSVVIPAYNEAERLPKTLLALCRYFETQPFSVELIVIDDGSQDQTAAIADDATWSAYRTPVRAIRNPMNRGKGFAVKQGVRAALKSHVLIYDADGATPIDELSRCLPHVAAWPDALLLGSRVLPGQGVQRRMTPVRRAVGRTFHTLVSLLAPGVSDTQCGFKLLPTATAQRCFRRMQETGFAFDVELLHIAHQQGIAIQEVPITWLDVPGSKVKLVRDSVRMAWSVLNIGMRSLMGRYSGYLG